MAEIDNLDPTNYSFTIDENDGFAIRMWLGDTTAEPFMYQPCYPNHSFPWGSKEEATAWAEAKIAELTDENALCAPNAPGEAGKPRLPSNETLAQSVADKLSAIGITKEELIVLLNGGIGGLK